MASDGSQPSGIILAQCKELNASSLYASAAALASFIVGSNQADAEVFITYGDSLTGMGEHKRALSAYRSAHDLSGARMRGQHADSAIDPVELVWKMAESQRIVGDYAGQKSTLETVTPQKRSLRFNVALGKLYRRLGGEQLALQCFQEALAQNPFSLEVIDHLAQLNVKEHDVIKHLAEHAHSHPWLASYVSGTMQMSANDHKAGQATFHALVQGFPESVEALAGLAVCHMEIGNIDEAAQSFSQVWSLPPSAPR